MSNPLLPTQVEWDNMTPRERIRRATINLEYARKRAENADATRRPTLNEKMCLEMVLDAYGFYVALVDRSDAK